MQFYIQMIYHVNKIRFSLCKTLLSGAGFELFTPSSQSLNFCPSHGVISIRLPAYDQNCAKPILVMPFPDFNRVTDRNGKTKQCDQMHSFVQPLGFDSVWDIDIIWCSRTKCSVRQTETERGGGRESRRRRENGERRTENGERRRRRRRREKHCLFYFLQKNEKNK